MRFATGPVRAEEEEEARNTLPEEAEGRLQPRVPILCHPFRGRRPAEREVPPEAGEAPQRRERSVRQTLEALLQQL